MDERQAAHVAAYLLLKARKHTLDKLKLTKLLYMAERLSLELRGFPMIYDTPVCMPHGPVLSTTLNITDYKMPSDEWRACVQKPDGQHRVRLVEGVDEGRLGGLSRRDREILDSVWERFGGMGTFQLRDYTHQLPEWRNPAGSSQTLEYEDILRAVGYDDDVAGELANDILYYKNEDRHIQQQIGR